MPNAYQTIRQAILDKHQIVATYKGHERLMCPHAIGSKQGKPQALFFQFGGGSSSGLGGGAANPNNWRCLTISELSNVTSRPGPWYTADNHARPSTCVDQIDVQVSF